MDSSERRAGRMADDRPAAGRCVSPDRGQRPAGPPRAARRRPGSACRGRARLVRRDDRDRKSAADGRPAPFLVATGRPVRGGRPRRRRARAVRRTGGADPRRGVARLHRVEPRRGGRLRARRRRVRVGHRRVARGPVRRRGCAGLSTPAPPPALRHSARCSCSPEPSGCSGGPRSRRSGRGLRRALPSPRARTRRSLGGRTSGPRCGYRSRRRPRAPGSPWGS